jgi:RNase P/RNase MRP subunit POP5
VSTHRPRYRYIAFRLEGPRVFRRDEVLEALRSSSSPRLWLVAFEGTSGLVRTTNIEKDAAIRFLNQMDHVSGEIVRLTTLGTSGTIRAATRKYGSTKRPRASSSEKEPL